MKTLSCSKCHLIKPEVLFGIKNDPRNHLRGFRNYTCMECERESGRKYREKYPDRSAETVRRWNKRTGNGKKVCARYRKKFPHVLRVGKILWRAVKRGEIKKPSSCSICGISGRIEAHHHDYSKPFQVEWVCRKCHRVRDKERRSLEAMT